MTIFILPTNSYILISGLTPCGAAAARTAVPLICLCHRFTPVPADLSAPTQAHCLLLPPPAVSQLSPGRHHTPLCPLPVLAPAPCLPLLQQRHPQQKVQRVSGAFLKANFPFLRCVARFSRLGQPRVSHLPAKSSCRCLQAHPCPTPTCKKKAADAVHSMIVRWCSHVLGVRFLTIPHFSRPPHSPFFSFLAAPTTPLAGGHPLHLSNPSRACL